MRVPQPPLAVVLGRRVHELRLRRDLSQTELSEALGISQAYLSAIERGVKFPSAPVIESLAQALAVDYEALFHSPDRVSNAAERDSEVEELANRVTEVITHWVTTRGPK